jgi:hypothetical protein
MGASYSAAGGSGVGLGVYQSTGGSGYQLEYNGDAVAVGSGTVKIPFDTVYITDDGSTSEDFTDEVDNGKVRFTPDSSSAAITFLESGLWLVKMLVDLSAVTTKPVRVRGGGLVDEYFPAGVTELSISEVVVADETVNAGTEITLKVDAADAALNVTYAWLSVTPLSGG